MPINYRSYATPNSSAQYSAEFFKTITFASARALQYPEIAHQGSVTRWAFDHVVPEHHSDIEFSAAEIIPHINDIQPVCRELESAFQRGCRSVIFALRVNGIEKCHRYHMSKIRLAVQINNNARAIRWAQELMTHVLENLHLSPFLLRDFEQYRIMDPISGFYITEFPLWKLGCLLGENWLEEDVQNVLAEMLYFRNSATHDDHSFVYLPTLFFNDARRLFHAQPRVYNNNIRNLRLRLSCTPATQIASQICVSDHYSSTFYHNIGSIEHGDSLQRSPPNDFLSIFCWVFGDLDYSLPHEIIEGEIALQCDGGFGSCGVAAHNFVECRANDGVLAWDPDSSDRIRNGMLRDLLIYHRGALGCPQYSECVGSLLDEKWISPGQDSDFENGFHGFNDFNLLYPLSAHPIHEFLRNIESEASWRANDMPDSKHPLYCFLPEACRNQQPTKSSADGDGSAKCAIDLSLDVEATPKGIKRARGDSSIVTRRPSQKVRIKSPSSSPELLSSPLAKLDLDYLDNGVTYADSDVQVIHDDEPLSLLQPAHQTQNTTCKQDTPVALPNSSNSIIDLCTPPNHSAINPKLESFDLLTRLSFSPTAIPKDEIIDFSTLTPIPLPREPSFAKLEPKHEVIDVDALDLPTTRHHQIPRKTTTSTPSRDPTISSGPIRVGSVFASWEDARDAIYHQEELRGFRIVMGQSTLDKSKAKKKITVRCDHYRTHEPKKRRNIDPSEFRKGKSIKTDCFAHWNVNRLQDSGVWHVTLVDNHHNHDRDIPAGGFATRPPTNAQRNLVSTLAIDPTFTRSHLSKALKEQNPDHPLEARQISNMIDKVRREGREEVRALGGDIPAVISALQEKIRNGEAWTFHMQFDENGTVTSLWWQSPEQAKLSRRYSDILINDNTYNRNQYQYPLDIGIALDNSSMSRNIWYCLHAREDLESHNWVLQRHQESAGQPPEVFCSDRHPSLIASVEITFPTTLHVFCLHHLSGNVTDNLHLVLGPNWQDFSRDFWTTYRSPSPREFERLWSELTERYPNAISYLNRELYPCREQWAWAWISYVFTGGVRTNGRVEGENRVNKFLGGPKVSFLQLFNGLNDRSAAQTAKEATAVRQASRHRLKGHMEATFVKPLVLMRRFLGPFALQKCYKEMDDSTFYSTAVVHRPQGLRNWTEFAIQNENDIPFEWLNNEQKSLINLFENDSSHISLQWLLRIITDRGLTVKHLLKISHLGGGKSVHYIALLADGRYICDCCMGLNLGIPCRHFFQALTKVQGLKFHIGLVRPRWYQDPSIDIQQIPAVRLHEGNQDRGLTLQTSQLSAPAVSNPLDRGERATTIAPNPTVGSRTVFREAQEALRPLLANIHHEDDLEALVERLDGLRREDEAERQREMIHDPPIITHKGRPRTARLTSRREGALRGGGPKANPKTRKSKGHISTRKAPLQSNRDEREGERSSGDDDDEASPPSTSSPPPKKRAYRCGQCKELGHKITSCPWNRARR